MGITNFECDGKCSNCGQCCGDAICVTPPEVRRIAKYVRGHSVNAFPIAIANGSVRVSCPFRNEAHKRCEVYPVRPLICKTFRCGMGEDASKANLEKLLKRPDATCLVSFNWVFLGDPRLAKVLGLPLVNREQWLGFSPKLLEEKK